MRILSRISAVLVLLLLLTGAAALAEGTLTLPAGLEVIEEEAFYGITAFDQVILPSGVREIHSRAFAGTGITEVTLPDSLTYIADDAFDGPGQVHVTVNPDTYAYRWAAGLGYLLDAPVQANSKGLRNKITVSWEAVEDAAGYNVYYGTSSNISDATEIKGVTETTWTIDNLESGTVYYSWVKAVNGIRVSVASNMKSVITYPEPPTITSASVSGNSITLNWEPVTGAAVYRIYYNTENDFDSTTATPGIQDTTYTISDLQYSTIYYLWIASVNSSGGLATSTPRYLSTEVDPFIPVQNDSVGQQKAVEVNWSAVEGADSYNVYYGTSEDISAAGEPITGITATEYRIPDLQSGTVYYTWIKAVRGTEESGPSNVKSVITYPAVPNMNEPAVSGNSITLSWNAVTGADYYRLYYGLTDNVSDAATVNNITNTEYTLENLEYNTDYYFWIASFNTSGGLRAANARSTTTGPEPSAPVQNTPQGQKNAVTVSWNAVEGAESYNVYYGTTTDIAEATELTGIDGTSCTISDLQSGTVYYTWVKAVTAEGPGSISARMSTITWPDAPTLKPIVVSGNSFTLTWTEVPGAVLYRIRYSATDDFETATRIDDIRTTTYTIENLEYNTQYYVWVTAANTSGTQRRKYQKTTDPDPLTPIQNASQGLFQKVKVSWEAVEGAVSYNVYYSESDDIAGASVLTGITGTEHTIPGLKSGTVYYTWIRAVDAERTGAASNVQSVITWPDYPTLNEPVVNGNSITLSWNEVPGAAVYRLYYSTVDTYSSQTATTIDNIHETTYTLENLEYDTTYYIWPGAANTSSGVRKPSYVSVTTSPEPDAPTE